MPRLRAIDSMPSVTTKDGMPSEGDEDTVDDAHKQRRRPMRRR